MANINNQETLKSPLKELFHNCHQVTLDPSLSPARDVSAPRTK